MRIAEELEDKRFHIPARGGGHWKIEFDEAIDKASFCRLYLPPTQMVGWIRNVGDCAVVPTCNAESFALIGRDHPIATLALPVRAKPVVLMG